MKTPPSEPPRTSPSLSRPKTRAVLFTLSLLLLCAGAARVRAQQGGDEDEVVRVNADLVVLNVTVTDASGQYVHKLSHRDFKVLEDGVEQRVSLFSVEETPFAAAILLDTSGSMETRLTLARAAAVRFLDGLREEDVAAVYHFDSKVEQLSDFSPGRDLPPVAYDLGSKGMTALNDAVLQAAKDLARRPEKRKAIIVLSDGADTKSGATLEKALNAALAANATIYTVDMADPQMNQMQRMSASGALKNYASKSGGRFVSKPGGQALDDAFREILQELSNQYTIGYRPSNTARDGRWRAIQLKLSRPELNARTRNGYRAPKG
jgi:Ca-activated chloride channel family protein